MTIQNEACCSGAQKNPFTQYNYEPKADKNKWDMSEYCGNHLKNKTVNIKS